MLNFLFGKKEMPLVDLKEYEKTLLYELEHGIPLRHPVDKYFFDEKEYTLFEREVILENYRKADELYNKMYARQKKRNVVK